MKKPEQMNIADEIAKKQLGDLMGGEAKPEPPVPTKTNTIRPYEPRRNPVGMDFDETPRKTKVDNRGYVPGPGSNAQFDYVPVEFIYPNNWREEAPEGPMDDSVQCGITTCHGPRLFYVTLNEDGNENTYPIIFVGPWMDLWRLYEYEGHTPLGIMMSKWEWIEAKKCYHLGMKNINDIDRVYREADYLDWKGHMERMMKETVDDKDYRG